MTMVTLFVGVAYATSLRTSVGGALFGTLRNDGGIEIGVSPSLTLVLGTS